MKASNKKTLEKIFEYDKYAFIALLAFMAVVIIFKINLPVVVAWLTLIVNCYLAFKHRKNIYLFFCMLSILFFNYSFIISKYISSTENLVGVYNQIKFDDTKAIGINCVFIFMCILGLFLSGKDTNLSVDTSRFQKSYSKRFTLFAGSIIIIMITLFIALAYGLGFSYLRALYEYSLILFILGFLLCRDNKIQTIILVILMLISMLLNLFVGGRIISLLPFIAFFFIFIAKYIDYKKFMAIMIIGIIFYTFFGLYGDIKDTSKDYSKLKGTYLVETMDFRKFALDTSISSYWTGLTYIELSNYDSFQERTNNFSEYILVYTPLGNKFGNYKQLYDKSKEKYIHYYGGYLTSYFYYWIGYFGVVLISCYVGYLLNFMRYNDKKSKRHDLVMVITVYVLATLPRWYLYYPATLFRGMLILIICYFLMDMISRLRCFNEKNN